jgi:flagellar hook-associated protein 3 FlgL
MSGITGATDLGTLNAVLYNASLTSQSISNLTAQSSSGYISADYAGLGPDAAQALDLTTQLAQNTAAQANTAAASTTSQVAQTALGQLQTLVSTISNQLLGASVSTQAGLSALATTAKADLVQVGELLNTKIGDTYVFAGQDSRNPPVPNPNSISSSAFVAAINTALAGLGTGTAASVEPLLLAAGAPGATSPFSATLEAANQPATADLGNGQTVQLGVLADQNSDAVSAGVGTTSTGSYTRDIFVGLATLAGLGSANPGDAQVGALLSWTQTSLSQAGDALNTDIAGLGGRQQTITNAQTELTATATAFNTQLGTVEDCNTAQVATQLSTAENQLQASYKIISELQQLTLAKFL